MRALVGRLYRSEDSQAELRKKVAADIRSERVSADHPTIPENFLSACESALGKGQRMHLDLLTGSPERNASRRAVQDISPPEYFAGEHCGFGIHDFDRHRFTQLMPMYQ
uniref:AlNc14C38G3332 protein n=1 Tax=Albugo laibachii Nc14 TaxID=890382 RepID=F0W965_9STRA|nr:AlNc14C38G3332 [Albugo laibachii Nc14]|eukprot:CCA17678.1 AlNc14C38G3332 [Albugo laibachii Nc14]